MSNVKELENRIVKLETIVEAIWKGLEEAKQKSDVDFNNMMEDMWKEFNSIRSGGNGSLTEL